MDNNELTNNEIRYELYHYVTTYIYMVILVMVILRIYPPLSSMKYRIYILPNNTLGLVMHIYFPQ